jgi:hypothetical protein
MVLKGGFKIMKMNIKKVATVLGSALMLGATAGIAAAAAYPAPFVQSGSANVAIVYGSNAALSDGIAATAIATDLATELAAQTATGATTGTSTVEGGDAVLIQSGSDNLNLGNALSIVGTLNDEDMETFLASGEYEDINKADYDYDQDITVAATNLTYSTSSAYEDKTPTIGLFYEKDADVLTYTIDFGDLNFTNAVGTDLPLMNNLYYVLDYDSTDGLILLDSSASATISEGETTTLTVDGKSYEITLDFVGDATTDYAKFTVNGESTDKINEGADEELADGSYIAVKEVLYSSKESGVSKVEFTIGTGKLLLPPAGEVEMNDERVVNVDSTVNSATGTISIDWNTDAKTVLTKAGDELVLPGFKTIKMSYNGMNFPSDPEATVLDAAGVIELDTVVKDGAVTIPLVNYDAVQAAGNLTYLGDDSDSKLVLGSTTSDNSSVSLTDIGDYFIATYPDSDDWVSYVYQLDSIKYGSDGKTEVVLDNLASTSTTDDITFADLGRSRTKGELTFVLASANETTEDVVLYVQGTGVTTRKLATANGLSIDLSALANYADASLANFSSGVNLTFTEQDKDQDFQDGSAFTVTIATSADENMQVSATNVSTLETKTDDVYEGYMLTDVATKVIFDKTDADAQDFAIHYNGKEVSAEVFVAASAVTISAGSGSTTGATQLGSITVKDTEASSVAGKNLIVIGGSCINSVAAELLEGAACEAAFTAKTGVKAGEALIKSFPKDGKTALLVAGYNAEDTTKAATYLVNKGLADTANANLKVTSATEATAITA